MLGETQSPEARLIGTMGKYGHLGILHSCRQLLPPLSLHTKFCSAMLCIGKGRDQAALARISVPVLHSEMLFAGKGRQIAALIKEHERTGGRRTLWISVSNDLRYDARRDLDDVDAQAIEVYPMVGLLL